MSICRASQPTAFIKRKAWSSVRVPVAKPGMVTPMMWLRGRPRASIARAHTSSACVESSPPEAPITSFLMPLAASRCVRPCTWMLYTSWQRSSRSARFAGT